MADITHYISASYIGTALENKNFLIFHTECNNPSFLVEVGGSTVISSASLASGLTLTLDDSISTLYLFPISSDCPLGCGYNYVLNLSLPPSATPSTTPAATPPPTPSPSPQVAPPDPSPDPSPSPDPTPDPTPIPGSPPPTPQPTVTPTRTPAPTPPGTPSPTPDPTPDPTVTPSNTPAASPAPTPTVTPSSSPPTATCTEYAVTAGSETLYVQYRNCQGINDNTTISPFQTQRVCVRDGYGAPTVYPQGNGESISALGPCNY